MKKSKQSKNHEGIDDILKQFNYWANKLQEYEKKFSNPQVRFCEKEDGGLKSLFEYKTEEEIAHSVNLIRFFCHTNISNLYFKKVCNRIIDEDCFEKYHKITTQLLSYWQELEISKDNPITINGKKESRWAIFQTWLNEGNAHKENFKPGSGKGLDRFSNLPTSMDIHKMIFCEVFLKASKVICEFNNRVVKNILDENETIEKNKALT